jgi:alpha-tubulin suppressor-like RCC1 family protein
MISAGGYFTCAVMRGGAAKCWGHNGSGQLGNNSTTSSAVPVDVNGLGTGVEHISAGSNHSCAAVTGAAKCWGVNGKGQLGNNSTAGSLIPVQVHGLTAGVEEVAAGSDSSCAVVHGAAKCWGNNHVNQLGNNSNNALYTPPFPSMEEIAASMREGRAPRVPDSRIGNDSLVPIQVPGLDRGVESIFVESSNVIAIVNGRIRGWGYNCGGQLGINSCETRAIAPVEPHGLGEPVEDVCCRNASTCAVVDGVVYGWGANGRATFGTACTSHQSLVPIRLN